MWAMLSVCEVNSGMCRMYMFIFPVAVAIGRKPCFFVCDSFVFLFFL